MRVSIILIGLGLALGATPISGPVQAQTDDHLKCYQIKGDLKLKGLVDIDTPQFGLDPGCKITKAKARATQESPRPLARGDMLGESSASPVSGQPTWEDAW